MFQIVDDAGFWDRSARKYAAASIADPAGYERTLQRTAHLLHAGDTVFEFGCGTGTTALRLAPRVARLEANDISGAMIAIAREKAEAEECRNVRFEVGTPADALPHGAAFDAALGFNILHLIADRAAALAGVHRLLKPGGLFISKTPCLNEMGLLLRKAIPAMQAVGRAPFVASLSEGDLVREIEAAGFDVVERARHGSRRKDMRAFLVARKR